MPAIVRRAAAVAALLILVAGSTSPRAQTRAQSPAAAQPLPNMGQHITPLAPTGAAFEYLNPGLVDHPDRMAGHAVTSAVSPDGATLLVLTSGFNRVYWESGAKAGQLDAASSLEYVFVYDISTGTPVKKQVLRIPNTYNGLAFNPIGQEFFVAGGSDDIVHVFRRNAAGTWEKAADTPTLPLGHKGAGNGLPASADVGFGLINTQVGVKPCAAGVAVSSDGKTLVVANYYNDTATVFTRADGGSWSLKSEVDLRPGKSLPADSGKPGGEYPFWVAVKGSGAGAVAYVSSLRDREIVVVSLGGTPGVRDRIRVKGEPNKMVLNASQSLLYVVEDLADVVDVIDTGTNRIAGSIAIKAPAWAMPVRLAKYTGANPNSVTLTPDEQQLYVTCGNLNAVAVIDLDSTRRRGEVTGLIPTAWYPNSVSFDARGTRAYVVNGKSPTGSNPAFCEIFGVNGYVNCFSSNSYIVQLLKAGLQHFPRPSARQMTGLTLQVALNDRFASRVSERDEAVMAAVRRGVKHVIFIIKENRTYDQVLGDLGSGNGDRKLAQFGETMTPNLHALARTFVTLDNFYATSEASDDGWPWTTAARAPDVVQRQQPVAYASRGLSLDTEGASRHVNVAIPTLEGRLAANPMTPNDPDLLPGQMDIAAPDGPEGEPGAGFIWNAALRAGLSVRNYGFRIDSTRYNLSDSVGLNYPRLKNPAATKTVVAVAADAALAPYTDQYFRGFDQAFPDYYRFKEWEREFDTDYVGVATGPGGSGSGLPALSLVRFAADHTGNFDAAIDRVNTPELQQADNDYAVGMLVEKISRSKYANDTLIFVIEDDAQDGPDHVDAHRTVALVAGAWVKRGAVVSARFNTVDFLRTIEEVLGLEPLNLNDAIGQPMAAIFSDAPHSWSFTAKPSAYLYRTDLPVGAPPSGLALPRPAHDAAYWTAVTRGMDFTAEDRFDFASYSRILWKGMMGSRPYPKLKVHRDDDDDRRP